jgi:tetratricopeptide (TPR) repeat protein
LFGLLYHPHNYHFLWACTTLEGRRKYALETSEIIKEKYDPSLMSGPLGFFVQHMSATPVFAMVRFGEWDSLLRLSRPGDSAVYSRAMWHYGRGVAFAKKGMPELAEKERLVLLSLMKDTTLNAISVGALNSPYPLMDIAGKVVAAEIYVAKKDYQKAIQILQKAIVLEDALNYNEPADWHHPVRQILGAVFIESGNANAAEKVYLEDLKTYPENGWSLYGLHQSLLKQGRKQEAHVVKQRYDKAFAYADIQLTSSRF